MTTYTCTIADIRAAAEAGEAWYEFSAWNSQSLVGYGTAAEAARYEEYLNLNREVNLYAASVVNDEWALRLSNGVDSDGFRLDLALDTLADNAEWADGRAI